MSEDARSRAVEAVRRLMERWDRGEIARDEIVGGAVALLDHDTIDAVVEALPDEHRAELLEYFEQWRPENAAAERVTIRGGTFFTRARHPSRFTDEEWDRIEREERERDAREEAHFANVTLPAILAWRVRNGR